MPTATVVSEHPNGSGYDGTIELVSSQGTWTLKLSSAHVNKVQRWADYQQQIYEFAAEIAKTFGVSPIVLK